MQPKFFDAHTHVNLAAFGGDYREAINRALALGIGLVNVGTQKDTSLRAIEIAREFGHEPVFATVGLHPIHTSKSFHDEDELGRGEAAKTFTSRGEVFDYEHYKRLATDSKVVAIGECGLDYYRKTSDKRQETGQDGWKEKQKSVFVEQIQLAKDVGKPLMIHCRQAFGDLIDILVSCRLSLLTNAPGIIHFFSGTKDEAKRLMDLEFYFTFGGVVTFTRDYDGVIRFLPVERILSETDAPYVAPAPYRGKRNEPAYVIEVVKKLAEIKGLSPEDMRGKILQNTARVFNIDF